MQVVFLSGDREICRQARDINPNITTVATKESYGGSTISLSREEALGKIKRAVKEALKKDLNLSHIDLPDKFEEIISFKDHVQAFKMMFYPGMEKIDDHTIKIDSGNYIDILTANMFVL